MSNEVKQGSWVQYGEMQSGEPCYWNVSLVDENKNVFAQRFDWEGKLEQREIAQRQYTIVTDESLCKKLTREFVGAE